MTVFTNEFSEEVWRTTHKWSGDKTIEDTHRRVAKTIASIEKTEELRKEWEEKFYDLLSDFKGSAGGRILSNAGTDWAGTTFINCFVGSLPDKDLDSLEGIYQVLLEQAKTLKSEGGWGMNFSWMRPRGSFIKGIGVDSPGAVKFMELFDKSSEIVTAGSGKKASNKNAKGKIRKGAMMGVLDCTHPDVIEFITAKQNSDRLSKFNISVNCTSEFMDLVSKGDPDLDWNLEFPDTEHERYRSEWNGDLKLWKSKGYPTVIHNTVKALWLWNLIMESTYNRNDPGVLFLDRANEFNPLSYKETILSTNPCGEQTLAPGGVCCLGSLNLTQFVNFKYQEIDTEKLSKYTKYMVRFLDNVNQISGAPLPEYVSSMRDKRRIGIGVMGWGSSLYMLRTRFGSKNAAKYRHEVMSTIARSAYEASIDLAIEKGKFHHCNPELHANSRFVRDLGLSDDYMAKLKKYGIRNSSLLSIQPTGNTAIECNNVSGGMEPVLSGGSRAALVRGKNSLPENNPDGYRFGVRFYRWVDRRMYRPRIVHTARPAPVRTARGINASPPLESPNRTTSPFSWNARARQRTISAPLQRRQPATVDYATLQDDPTPIMADAAQFVRL
jgi:ribonucleoside-diphosphate reductase alpha chain